ncbi:MAG: periplasmic heavy metal sensor [Pseudomonadota bacterium]
MKNNFLKYILILSLLLNFSFLGAAGYTHYKQSRYRQPPQINCGVQGGHLFEELSLKPEQIKLFQHKAPLFHSTLNKKRQEVDYLRGSLFGLMGADNPDHQAIEAAITQINDRQHEMQKMVVAHMLEFKSMLDKDQQKKFLGLIEGAMGKRREALCP